MPSKNVMGFVLSVALIAESANENSPVVITHLIAMGERLKAGIVGTDPDSRMPYFCASHVFMRVA